MNNMQSIFDISGKVAVLTGPGGVLGSVAAHSLAKAGVNLVLLTRDKTKLTGLTETLQSHGVKVIVIEVDILSKASLIQAKDRVVKKFGKVDILLNIAGGNLPGATIRPDQTIFDLDIKDFDEVNRLNLQGTVLPSIVFGEVMAKQKKGSIINYSSMAVDRVITRVVGYSASKAAMENFTRWMAVEMATKFGDQIRVNAIAPGFFVGNQNRALLLNEDGTFTERGSAIIRNTPMGRFGNPDELNGAIQFLSSDASKFVTGIVLPIDGGFNAFSGV